MAIPQNSAAPSIPVATETYSRVAQDQLNNVLRLYFNLQDNNIAQIIQAVGTATTIQWLGGL